MGLSSVTLFDYLGTFAFAVSGIKLAAKKELDVFGALVIGFVTAVGGGTIRDLCIGATPFWMTQPSYLTITILALAAVIVARYFKKEFNRSDMVADALGLAFFTVVGVEKSIAAGFPFWVNIMMGAITGAAGGMLRDVFVNEVPSIFRKDIYAVASVAGGVVFYLFRICGANASAQQMSCLITVVVIRLVCWKFRLNLPAFKSDN